MRPRIKVWPIMSNRGKSGISNISDPHLLWGLNDNTFWNGNWFHSTGYLNSDEKGIIRELITILMNKSPYLGVYITEYDDKDEIDYINKAKGVFESQILMTKDKYLPIIQLMKSEMNDLMDLQYKETHHSEGIGSSTGTNESSGSNTSNASTESSNMSASESLNKYNDTRSAGDNANLLSDTYLTNSTRNEDDSISSDESSMTSTDTNTSEQSSSSTVSNEMDSYTTRNDHVDRLNKLTSSLMNMYQVWIRDLESVLSNLY